MEEPTRPKHFSMIRGFHLADFFTLANAACGFSAVLLTMLYLQSGVRAHFYAAAAMASLAFFFDWLDGNVARWWHQHSALGRELDSLSDVISFGVAPAVLAYAAGLALTAIGARFLINDAVLIPLFVALLGLSLWLLFRSARVHRDLRPVYLAGLGALGAVVSLWTSNVVLFTGLGLMVASDLWDHLGARATR